MMSDDKKIYDRDFLHVPGELIAPLLLKMDVFHAYKRAGDFPSLTIRRMNRATDGHYWVSLEASKHPRSADMDVLVYDDGRIHMFNGDDVTLSFAQGGVLATAGAGQQAQTLDKWNAVIKLAEIVTGRPAPAARKVLPSVLANA